MKNTSTQIKFLGILLVFLFVFTGYAQTPTYQAVLANDTLVSGTVYEFDIYLLRTGAAALELSGCQVGLTLNDSVRNGGTLSAIIIPGTSQLNTAQAPANPNLATLQGTTRIFKLASKAPPGAGNGSIISDVSPGTKVGRFRLTNTVNFSGVPANFAWTFSAAQYQTKIAAYIAGVNTDITTQPTHQNNLANFPLPVELTSFNSEVNNRNVELKWQTASELGTSVFQVERKKVNESGAFLNWEKVGEVKASGTSTSMKEYNFSDGKLNAGKYNYRLKMVDFDGTYEYSKVVEAEVALPKDYAISQNYPNPFNPTTRIDYQLPFDSKVTLELYGITGERIATLINGELTAGYYTADVNASALNLASGVYIYRMTAQIPNAQNFVQVKKLMLTK